jgi:predicted dehydrogenase
MRVKSYPSEQESSWWKPFTSQTLSLDRRDPILAQMNHFAQVVRGEVVPLVSARDGLMNLMVTEAIALAAKEERTVKIASNQV